METFEKIINKHDGDYVVNNEPTIADLQLYYELLDLRVQGITLDAYPGISAWADKVAALKEVVQVQEINAVAVAPLLAAFAQSQNTAAAEQQQ